VSSEHVAGASGGGGVLGRTASCAHRRAYRGDRSGAG
jgi:hypothetical protein